jgi:hypothetical protein
MDRAVVANQLIAALLKQLTSQQCSQKHTLTGKVTGPFGRTLDAAANVEGIAPDNQKLGCREILG